MTFIHGNSKPGSPIWLLHLPSQTLARLHLSAQPNHPHLVTVEAEQPPADEVFQSFAQAGETAFSDAVAPLVMRTCKTRAKLPPHIVLCHLTEGAAVIHFPALGFTAGIRADGSKIPPVWRNYDSFSSAQRSWIMHKAANTLMREIAKFV